MSTPTSTAKLLPALRRISTSADPPVRTHLLQTLRVLFAAGVVPPQQAPLFAAIVAPHLQDTQPAVARAASRVLEVMPLGALSGIAGGVPLANGSALRRHLHRAMQATLTLDHFEQLVPPLIKDAQSRLAQPTRSTLTAADAGLLTSMLDACCVAEGSGTRGTTTVLSQMFPAMQQLLFSWAARYCVEQKLATSFGKADKTLEAVERPLRELSAQLSGREALPTLAVRPSRATSDTDDAANHSTDRRAAAKLLLLWLDAFERQLLHGCAPVVSFPSLSPASQLFFRANGAVCYEWLARVRTSAMLAGSVAASPTTTVYHGMEHLRRLAKDVRSGKGSPSRRQAVRVQFQRTCVSLAEALIQLRRGDVLHGLACWAAGVVAVAEDAKEIASAASEGYPPVGWLEAAALEASGRLSAAADLYKITVQAFVQPQASLQTDAGVLAFAVARSRQCFAELRAAAEAAAWQQELATHKRAVEEEADTLPPEQAKVLRDVAMAVDNHASADQQRWALLGAFDSGDHAKVASLLGPEAPGGVDLVAQETAIIASSLRAMLLLQRGTADDAREAWEHASRAANAAEATAVGLMAESALLANHYQALAIGSSLLRDAATPGVHSEVRRGES